MFHRRLSWAQLVRNGVPNLFVLRPRPDGFTPPKIGDEYPAPDPTDKFQMMRARQMYEQRHIGNRQELESTLARSRNTPLAGQHKEQTARGETHGRRRRVQGE